MDLFNQSGLLTDEVELGLGVGLGIGLWIALWIALGLHILRVRALSDMGLGYGVRVWG